MSITIKLCDIIDDIDLMSSEMQTYLNIKTCAFVTIADYLGSEKAIAEIKVNPDNFVLLPTLYDINEYGIMEDFIDENDSEAISDELYESIKGKGAFRRFKDTINNLYIENKWFDFQSNALKKIAIERCEENNISYSSVV